MRTTFLIHLCLCVISLAIATDEVGSNYEFGRATRRRTEKIPIDNLSAIGANQRSNGIIDEMVEAEAYVSISSLSFPLYCSH